MRHAVIYTRATPAETRHGWRVQDQLRLCETWCRARNVTVRTAIHEESRTIWFRGGEVVNLILGMPGTGLVVADLNRISQRPVEVLRVVSRLSRLGWIAAVRQGIDTFAQAQVALAWRAIADLEVAEPMADPGRMDAAGPRSRNRIAPFGYKWLYSDGEGGRLRHNVVVRDEEKQVQLSQFMDGYVQGKSLAKMELAAGMILGTPRGRGVARAVRMELRRRIWRA